MGNTNISQVERVHWYYVLNILSKRAGLVLQSWLLSNVRENGRLSLDNLIDQGVNILTQMSLTMYVNSAFNVFETTNRAHIWHDFINDSAFSIKKHGQDTERANKNEVQVDQSLLDARGDNEEIS